MTNTGGPRPLRRRGLLSTPGFSALFVGGIISDIGAGAASLGVTLLAVDLTRSTVFAGVIAALAMGAPALWAIPAGWLSDALPRRPLMVASLAVSALAFLILSVLAVYGALTPLVLLLMDVTASLGALTYQSCVRVLVREIVAPERVGEAVSMLQARGAVAMMIGPAIGGALYAIFTAGPLLLMVVTSATALLFLVGIRPRRPRGSRPPLSVAELVVGVLTLGRDRILRRLVCARILMTAAVTGLIFGLIVALRKEGQDPIVVALVEASFGVGLVLGATLLRRVTARLSAVSFFGCGLGIIMVAIVAAAFVPWQIAMVCVALVAIIVGPMLGVLAQVEVARIPVAIRGRVLSANEALSQVLGALGPLGIGASINTSAERGAIGLLGLLVVLSALILGGSDRVRSNMAKAAGQV